MSLFNLNQGSSSRLQSNASVLHCVFHWLSAPRVLRFLKLAVTGLVLIAVGGLFLAGKYSVSQPRASQYQSSVVITNFASDANTGLFNEIDNIEHYLGQSFSLPIASLLLMGGLFMLYLYSLCLIFLSNNLLAFVGSSGGGSPPQLSVWPTANFETPDNLKL